MGDQLEARINVVERVQEEFGHKIREIKKELARMAKLIEPRTEAKVVHPQEFSPSSTQPFRHFGQHPNPRPSIPMQATRLVVLTCDIHWTFQRPRQFIRRHPCLAINQAAQRTTQKDQKLVQIESDRT